MSAALDRPRDLQIEVPRREVLRYMGYPRGRSPRPRVARDLDRLWRGAEQLIRPRGVVRLVNGADAVGAGMPDPSERVGVGLCTIGPTLERACAARGAGGEMLEALFLDAFGSAAAEATADALNVVLCQHAAALGQRVPPRVSPGYGRWDIAGQPRLLALLDADALGITLTPALMMLPRKSISFAARLLPGDQPRGAPRSRCALCSMRDRCAYRR